MIYLNNNHYKLIIHKDHYLVKNSEESKTTSVDRTCTETEVTTEKEKETTEHKQENPANGLTLPPYKGVKSTKKQREKCRKE